MLGMSRTTGRQLDGEAHLQQSIGDILSTPIGTRVGRRDYGSLIPELIDQPMNGAGRLRLFAAAALALSRWETRIKVAAMTLTGVAGAYALRIEATRTDVATANAATILTVPLRPTGTLAAFS